MRYRNPLYIVVVILLIWVILRLLGVAADKDLFLNQSIGGPSPEATIRVRVVPIVNGILVFNGTPDPVASLVLPNGVQDNITRLGSVTVGSIPTTLLTGNITNAQLANDSITINGVEVFLGGSVSNLQTTNGVLALAGFSAITGNLPAANLPANAQLTDGTLAIAGFSGITGIVPPANLGTGSSITTKYLRGDGTWQTLASGSGDMLGANNLSELTNTATARTNLGATTVGSNFFTKADPSAIRFPRVNADNSVDFLSDSAFRTAIGVGSGTGDVVGPASSTNNFIAQWDGTTGKLLKNGLESTTGTHNSSDAGKVPIFESNGELWATYFYANNSATGYSLYKETEILIHDGVANFLTIRRPTGAFGANNLLLWPNPAGTNTIVATSDGTVPVKAWVNFNGTTAANVSGTYARTSPSTTVQVAVMAHGHIVGHVVYLDFTTGTGVDGLYTITSITSVNDYTVTTAASTTTSGNVTELRRTINGSSGIHSVTYANSAGYFYVNFTVAMADAEYAAVGNASGVAAGHFLFPSNAAAPTAQVCPITTTNFAGTPSGAVRTHVIFAR